MESKIIVQLVFFLSVVVVVAMAVVLAVDATFSGPVNTITDMPTKYEHPKVESLSADWLNESPFESVAADEIGITLMEDGGVAPILSRASPDAPFAQFCPNRIGLGAACSKNEWSTAVVQQVLEHSMQLNAIAHSIQFLRGDQFGPGTMFLHNRTTAYTAAHLIAPVVDAAIEFANSYCRFYPHFQAFHQSLAQQSDAKSQRALHTTNAGKPCSVLHHMMTLILATASHAPFSVPPVRNTVLKNDFAFLQLEPVAHTDDMDSAAANGDVGQSSESDAFRLTQDDAIGTVVDDVSSSATYTQSAGPDTADVHCQPSLGADCVLQTGSADSETAQAKIQTDAASSAELDNASVVYGFRPSRRVPAVGDTVLVIGYTKIPRSSAVYAGRDGEIHGAIASHELALIYSGFRDLSVAIGQITAVNQYFIVHSASVLEGQAGSPLILLDDLKEVNVSSPHSTIPFVGIQSQASIPGHQLALSVQHPSFIAHYAAHIGGVSYHHLLRGDFSKKPLLSVQQLEDALSDTVTATQSQSLSVPQ